MRYSLVDTRERFSEDEPPTARMPRVVSIGRRLLAIMAPLTVGECEELLRVCRRWVEDRPEIGTRLAEEADLNEVTHIKIDF